MMVIGSQSYAIDILFAVMIIWMVISLVLTGAVKQMETRLSRWRPPRGKTF